MWANNHFIVIFHSVWVVDPQIYERKFTFLLKIWTFLAFSHFFEDKLLATNFCIFCCQLFEKIISWEVWGVFWPKMGSKWKYLFVSLIAAQISKAYTLLNISRNFWQIWKKVNHIVPYAYSHVGSNLYVHIS